MKPAIAQLMQEQIVLYAIVIPNVLDGTKHETVSDTVVMLNFLRCSTSLLIQKQRKIVIQCLT